MTGPLDPNSVGSVVGEMRITTDKVDDDIRDGLDRAGKRLEQDSERRGKRIGDFLGKGVREGNALHLNKIADDFRITIDEIQAEFDGIDLDIDTERGRRGGRGIFGSILDGFRSALRGNRGAFGDLFQNLIGGPVGALFNVSGRSPIIVLLIPLLGFIVTLITAAVYGLQAFVSLLYLIPSLLFGIGLQAAALFFIFGGLGETIAAAFAAKNAAELEEVLKGVNTEVADFIKQLLPWRDFFTQVRDLAQAAFFGVLDSEGIGRVLENIRGPFAGAIYGIAQGLAVVANSLLDVFSSKSFANLIDVLGDSTTQWLMGFGPALANFIDGLNDFAIAIDPFLDWFGTQFNNMISGFGDTLRELGQDPEFLQWLEDAKVIMKDFITLIGAVWDAVRTFIAQFIAADQEIAARHGGQGFLATLTELTILFTDFLASDVGREALEGVIIILLTLTAAFYILIAAVLAVAAVFNFLWEGFERLIGLRGPLEAFFGPFVDDLKRWGEEIWGFMSQIAATAINTFIAAFTVDPQKIVNVLKSIKDAIVGFFTDAGAWLRDAGIRLIQGLANGIRAAIPAILVPALVSAATTARRFFPFSPAKEGPLSGSGDPFNAGKSIISRLAAGISMETPALSNAMTSATSNITFGAGAVQVNYSGGVPPTQQQSQAMGHGAGRGIVDSLTATRFAIRTM